VAQEVVRKHALAVYRRLRGYTLRGYTLRGFDNTGAQRLSFVQERLPACWRSAARRQPQALREAIEGEGEVEGVPRNPDSPRRGR
jgi:hypothetical protein